MASLLLVTGPPGAGKSTTAQLLVERFEPSVLVAGDQFFAFLARGAIPPWLSEANDQNEVVTRAAASAAGRFAMGGFTTVYDGVVGPWFLPTFAEETGLDFLDYVILLPTLDQCIERVVSRVGHGFTDVDATRHMHKELVEAKIDPRHVLKELPASAGETAELILEAAADGKFRFHREP